jgi:hypothetical protein
METPLRAAYDMAKQNDGDSGRHGDGNRVVSRRPDQVLHDLRVT